VVEQCVEQAAIGAVAASVTSRAKDTEVVWFFAAPALIGPMVNMEPRTGSTAVLASVAGTFERFPPVLFPATAPQVLTVRGLPLALPLRLDNRHGSRYDDERPRPPGQVDGKVRSRGCRHGLVIDPVNAPREADGPALLRVFAGRRVRRRDPIPQRG